MSKHSVFKSGIVHASMLQNDHAKLLDIINKISLTKDMEGNNVFLYILGPVDLVCILGHFTLYK